MAGRLSPKKMKTEEKENVALYVYQKSFGVPSQVIGAMKAATTSIHRHGFILTNLQSRTFELFPNMCFTRTVKF